MQKIVDDCLFYVNGNKVAFETAEQSGEFKLAVYDGKNTLVVRVIPPDNPGIPHEQSARSGFGPNGGLLCMDGPTFISAI